MAYYSHMNGLPEFNSIVHDAAIFLEHNRKCNKHHVEHTGSNAYLLDFYDYLGEIEKGKRLVEYLLVLIVDNPWGGRVFYPGHINPMNMSQNVIDTGTAVDAIARFARRRSDAFNEDEHRKIKEALRDVVDTYLAQAALEKKITNQRLWGLTGVASYARYVGEERQYRDLAGKSIDKAFSDMTNDGFFYYYPDSGEKLSPYDGITAFYQSRHTAFILYSLKMLGMNLAPYSENIGKSVVALLSMYTANGYKDMRMECKRWYWLSNYEVASHSFDGYTLAYSGGHEAEVALGNVLFNIRKHFLGGSLRSHLGGDINFQCSIFWTAHLAWLLRIKDIERLFNSVNTLSPFAYTFKGKEIFTQTAKGKRVLINSRFQQRNYTTGIFENGLIGRSYWLCKMPESPHAYLFSIWEVVNHTWYALRGLYVKEAILRTLFFVWDFVTGLLPRYSLSYGQIKKMSYIKGAVQLIVNPASKYGTIDRKELIIKVDIDSENPL